jgi:hypothetical protein
MSAPPIQIDLSDAEQECGDNALGRVRRAYSELGPGESLLVISAIAEQAFAVRAWSRKVGATLVEEPADAGRRRMLLRAGPSAGA